MQDSLVAGCARRNKQVPCLSPFQYVADGCPVRILSKITSHPCCPALRSPSGRPHGLAAAWLHALSEFFIAADGLRLRARACACAQWCARGCRPAS